MDLGSSCSIASLFIVGFSTGHRPNDKMTEFPEFRGRAASLAEINVFLETSCNR